MPSFRDAMGREWLVQFDGITLKELRDAHKIDLSDVVGSIYSQLKRDPALLTVALAFLCADKIKDAKLTAKEFAASIKGTVIDDAFAALWGAAEGFFPPKHLSVLSSRLEEETKMQDGWAQIKPLMGMLSQPEVPSEIREQVWVLMAKMFPTDLSSLMGGVSATGPEGTPPTAATS